MSILIIESSFAECTYSLNASLQDIKNWQTSNNNRFPNYPRTFELIQNIDQVDQKATGSISHLSNTPVDRYVTSKKLANFRAQYPDITKVPSNLPMIDTSVSTSGIVVLESTINVANLNIDLGAVTDSYEFGYSLIGSSQQKIELGLDIVYGKYNNNMAIQPNGDYIYITLGSFKPDGNGFTTFNELTRKFHKITIPIDGKIKVGIYVNQTTKQVGYIVNGVNYGYLNIILGNAISSIGYSASINQNSHANSLLIGKNVTLQLITDHSKMQLTYPSGAKDICGTVL